MSNKTIIRIASLLMLISCHHAWAQTKDVYVAPTGKLMTHPQAQMGVIGDIINDALGGIDNFYGGTIYLYRTPTIAATPSRVYDGPNATSSTGMYNAGGPFIRVFNLTTDNTTLSAVPSGSYIDSSSGAGDIQIEQEVRITNEHHLENGIIWTPRDQWQHAYLLYEDHAFHTEAGPNNTSGPHVDGYVAYEGVGSFVFPIGNGSVARKAGLKNPDQGIYRAAYFHRNPQLGTSGISGNSASTGPLGTGLIQISTQEFWDIDGTGLTNITLSAQNGGQNYSAWNTDFAAYNGNTAVEFGIAAWDEWEYLGNQTPTNNINAGGYYATTIPVKPDSFGTGGQPFAAFTWAVATASNLALEELDIQVIDQGCDALIRIHTRDEEDTRSVHIYRTDPDGNTIEITQFPTEGNTVGDHYYTYLDTELENSTRYIYSVEIIDEDGTTHKSNTVSHKSNCRGQELWKTYPSPTEGMVYLEVSRPLSLSQIQVHDIIGRRVSRISVDPSQRRFEVDLTGLPAGQYVISVLDDLPSVIYSVTVVRAD